MKNTDTLFELIRALSKAEKRHFKMTASRYAKNQNNNLLLFDAIDQQTSYDEEKLKRKFKAKALGRNIGKAKYLLYQLILKSLRPLHDTKSINSQLNGLLHSVEFLCSKGLCTQASSLLQKAKTQAIHYQFYPYYLRVLSYEKKLVGYNPKRQIGKHIASLTSEFEEVSGQTRTEMRYETSLEKLHLLSFSKEIEEWTLILHQELESLPVEEFSSSPTFRSKILRTELLALKASSNKRHKKATGLYRSIFNLWKENQHLIPLYQNDFNRGIEYFIQSLLLQNDTDADLKTILIFLKELQKEGTETERFKKQLENNTLEFIIHLTKGNTELSALQMIFIQDHLSQIKSLFSEMKQTKLFYHIAIYYLLKRDFSETLEWIQKTNHQENNQIFPRDKRFLKLMELIAHYELGEYEYLASAIRNQYRTLQRGEEQTRIETLVLKSVKRLINASQKEEANAIFLQLYQSLIEMDSEKSTNNNLQTNLLYQWVTNNLPKEKEEHFNN